MGLLTQGVEVECGRSGAPVRVLWEGRVHSVAEEPVRLPTYLISLGKCRSVDVFIP